MRRKFLNFLLILLIGGLGGVLADSILLPYLAHTSPFSKIGFIRQIGDGTVIINRTEEIIITENIALEQAIDKVNPCLVAIQAYQNKRLIAQGTGFIVTSDGWVVTAADLAPNNADIFLVYRNGDSFIVQTVRRDSEDGLALLKIEQNNLPVVSLTELENIHLGEQIILIGAKKTKETFYRFVNLGTIRGIEQGILEVNLKEDNYLANGGPLVNIEGEVIGLNLVDRKGLIRTIPSNKIKDFLSVL